MEPNLVTPAGLKKLRVELRALRSRHRVLMEALSTAPDQAGARRRAGDLDDVAELSRLADRIAVLEEGLGSVTVVEPDLSDGEVGLGECVRVLDLESGETSEYRVVGAGEADPAAGSISYQSPLGSAVLGRRIGDVVEVNAPKGARRLEILAIHI